MAKKIRKYFLIVAKVGSISYTRYYSDWDLLRKEERSLNSNGWLTVGIGRVKLLRKLGY